MAIRCIRGCVAAPGVVIKKGRIYTNLPSHVERSLIHMGRAVAVDGSEVKPAGKGAGEGVDEQSKTDGKSKSKKPDKDG